MNNFSNNNIKIRHEFKLNWGVTRVVVARLG